METTFNQYIGDTSFSIRVPMSRVETLINKIDALNDIGNFKKAFGMVQPFLVNPSKLVDTAVVVKKASSGGDKKARALAIISSMEGDERGKIIKAIQEDMGISYANARHYVVNVAGI
jgi:hypothetical protein